MGIGRIGKHLLHHHWWERRYFPPKVLAAIEQAIKAGEATHSGQVRFVVEGALDGAPLFRDQPARERALDIFSQLRIWDTAHNNGVLIYLLLADRNVEIVADRGIDAKVGAAGWEKICAAMEADFRAGNFDSGVIKGIEAVSRRTGGAFSATRRRAERTAGCAGGDLGLSRHCERSEAIQYAASKAGLLRRYAPRNDGENATPSPKAVPPTRANHATMLALAGSSGWPTRAPKSSQQ